MIIWTNKIACQWMAITTHRESEKVLRHFHWPIKSSEANAVYSVKETVHCGAREAVSHVAVRA